MLPRSRRRLLIAGIATIVAMTSLGALSASIQAAHGRAPDFTLTAASGSPFRLEQQRGRAVALVFGYTHCPDVCPTTLAALARAKRKLGERANSLEVVFITVDPQRDTPAVLRRYVRLFDPSFIGLRGTTAELDAVYAAYHIFEQVLPRRAGGAGYDVAHSSAVTLIGPDGRITGTGEWDDSPDRLAAELRRTLT
jgi:protein SCO1/2